MTVQDKLRVYDSQNCSFKLATSLIGSLMSVKTILLLTSSEQPTRITQSQERLMDGNCQERK